MAGLPRLDSVRRCPKCGRMNYVDGTEKPWCMYEDKQDVEYMPYLPAL